MPTSHIRVSSTSASNLNVCVFATLMGDLDWAMGTWSQPDPGTTVCMHLGTNIIDRWFLPLSQIKTFKIMKSFILKNLMNNNKIFSETLLELKNSAVIHKTGKTKSPRTSSWSHCWVYTAILLIMHPGLMIYSLMLLGRPSCDHLMTGSTPCFS